MDTILSRFNKIGSGKFFCKMDWAFKLATQLNKYTNNNNNNNNNINNQNKRCGPIRGPHMVETIKLLRI